MGSPKPQVITLVTSFGTPQTGHQHQYVCDLAGNLRYISDPLPGKTHDAKAFRDLQLDHHFNESNAFADKGYVGCGATTPFKKPAGGELLEWHKEFNKGVHSGVPLSGAVASELILVDC